MSGLLIKVVVEFRQANRRSLPKKEREPPRMGIVAVCHPTGTALWALQVVKETNKECIQFEGSRSLADRWAPAWSSSWIAAEIKAKVFPPSGPPSAAKYSNGIFDQSQLRRHDVLCPYVLFCWQRVQLSWYSGMWAALSNQVTARTRIVAQ